MNANRMLLLGVLVAFAAALLAWGCGRQGASGPRSVKIAVTDRGFVPREITVKEGQPVTLLVTRKTDATCAREIVIADTGVQRDLPLDREVAITFTPERRGELHYACGMGMVSGTLHVQ